MEYKELFGVISSLIAAGISVAYIYTMVRGRTRPHLYTYVIDALLTGIAFFGAVTAGAGAGAWNLGVAAVFVVAIVVFAVRYGTKDVTSLDAVFALSAGLAIIPWLITRDPMLSVVLTSLINLLSVVPTFRKTWNDPYSEPWTIWAINGSKHIFAIAATSVFSLTTLAYPVSVMLMNAAFVFMVLYRRKKMPPHPITGIPAELPS